MELRGTQGRLRPADTADADRLAEILAMPEVGRWWPAYDRERVEADLLAGEKDVSVYAILLDDRVVGLIQATDENEPEFRHELID